MKNLLVLTGGASAERFVSIKSYNAFVNSIDTNIFNIISVMILPDKTWMFNEKTPCNLALHEGRCMLKYENEMIHLDLALPFVLGDAESGELMGLFASFNLPHVGSDVLSSAICFDKIFNKRIAQTYNIPIVPFIEYSFESVNFEKATQRLACKNLIVKASRSGSSLGTNKACNQQEFALAIVDAKKYDTNVLIEKCIENVREIFCSVYQNEHGEICTSLLSEVFFEGEIFTYEIKNTPSLKRFEIPANIDEKLTNIIRNLAAHVFRVFRCKGYARVDFFLDKNDVYYSEINTIPGSSDASSFTRMLLASGVSKEDLMLGVLKFAK
jgi:D-alanine-D-alanine ligase